VKEITVQIGEQIQLLAYMIHLEKQVDELQTRMSEMVVERQSYSFKYDNLYDACQNVLMAFGDEYQGRLDPIIQIVIADEERA
jgi:hypothetical protein